MKTIRTTGTRGRNAAGAARREAARRSVGDQASLAAMIGIILLSELPTQDART